MADNHYSIHLGIRRKSFGLPECRFPPRWRRSAPHPPDWPSGPGRGHEFGQALNSLRRKLREFGPSVAQASAAATARPPGPERMDIRSPRLAGSIEKPTRASTNCSKPTTGMAPVCLTTAFQTSLVTGQGSGVRHGRAAALRSEPNFPQERQVFALRLLLGPQKNSRRL